MDYKNNTKEANVCASSLFFFEKIILSKVKDKTFVHEDMPKEKENDMALTRKFLSALGIEPDKIDEIIEAHAETVNGLKGERDGFKESADKLVEVQNKLKEAEKQIEGYGKDGYKSKYDELQSEYKAYKESIEKEKLTANKSEAYKAMLKEAGVSEKRLGAIVKLTDLSNVELDGDKLKDADKLMESAKKEWAEFIVDTHSEGADTPTPPSGDGKTPKTIPQIF